MKALKSKTLKYFVFLTFSFAVFTVSSVDAGDCDFDQVLMDCIDTAQEDYMNGDIDLETFYEFKNIHCPAAATSCLEEA